MADSEQAQVQEIKWLMDRFDLSRSQAFLVSLAPEDWGPVASWGASSKGKERMGSSDAMLILHRRLVELRDLGYSREIRRAPKTLKR